MLKADWSSLLLNYIRKLPQKLLSITTSDKGKDTVDDDKPRDGKSPSQ